MVSELFTVTCATDGSNTTGTTTMTSDIIYGSVNYIRIPKGMKAKIWCKRISGDVATKFTIQYSHDVGFTSPKTVSVERITSEGEITLEKRRPIILRGLTGNEAFRVTWEQASAGNAFMELEVELSED
ncbi:hypothetical protein DRH29_05495 [candidate division Kazan bacterium]|uniref:Uncharacterized protein n=1 Tax=candidate division Kazan bacterium TaxID=2202143 RepID=A0A420ZB50_UNCK3|nr:MAG: hypothetical protein DRH29_05495 [candidate division Kazan bacterium]